MRYNLLVIICFFMFCMVEVYAQTEKLRIEACINTFSDEESKATKVGKEYWFVDKDFLDGRTLKLSVVDPYKSTHAPHQHEEDEFFFVIEGRAEFFLNGQTKVVEPLTTLYCPSNSLHGIKNVGDKVLKYLVIKKYIKE